MTEGWYIGLVGLIAVERLVELRISKTNAAAQLAKGAREFGTEHYPFMVALHTALLIGCVVEVTVLDRPFVPLLSFAMLAILVMCLLARYWIITSLKGRWTTKVIVVPGDARIRAGPYRFIDHPNYVIVVLEGIALPLIHTNWATALIFGILNAALLQRRIRAEEAALQLMRDDHE